MKNIAKNEYYELSYEETENIVYWKMKGFWKDMSVVPVFHKDWDDARKLTKPGWKIFSDVSECRVVTADVNAEKAKNQEKAIENGCVKIALIGNSTITKMSIVQGARLSGAHDIIRTFDASQSGEGKNWLKG